MVSRANAVRPLRSLLQQLPKLPLTKKQEIDFPAADPALLVAIAEDAETTMHVIHLGIGAIGGLLASASVEIEDGTVGADSVESLGYLMAELGDLAAGAMVLAARCRQETTDYTPRRATKPAQAAS